jgi:hypothetical protein
MAIHNQRRLHIIFQEKPEEPIEIREAIQSCDATRREAHGQQALQTDPATLAYALHLPDPNSPSPVAALDGSSEHLSMTE